MNLPLSCWFLIVVAEKLCRTDYLSSRGTPTIFLRWLMHCKRLTHHTQARRIIHNAHQDPSCSTRLQRNLLPGCGSSFVLLRRFRQETYYLHQIRVSAETGLTTPGKFYRSLLQLYDPCNHVLPVTESSLHTVIHLRSLTISSVITHTE